MPVVSDAQRAAMYAAKAGHSTLGIPQNVGADFIAASHGLKGLPKRAGAAPRKPHKPAKPPVVKRQPFGSLAPMGAPTQSGHYDGDMPE